MYSFRHFVEKKPIWVQDSSLVIPGRRDVDRSLAQYTGGMVKVYLYHQFVQKLECFSLNLLGGEGFV